MQVRQAITALCAPESSRNQGRAKYPTHTYLNARRLGGVQIRAVEVGRRNGDMIWSAEFLAALHSN